MVVYYSCTKNNSGGGDDMDAETKQAFTEIMTELKGVQKCLDGMNARFDGIDERLDGMDAHFDGIDERLDGMDARFDGIDERLDSMDARFDGIDERFDGVDKRLERLEQGQEQLAQNTATILNAITVYAQQEEKHYKEVSERIDTLSQKSVELERVQDQHSIDIMKLRAAQ